MEKEIIYQQLDIQLNQVSEKNNIEKVDELFELQEISVQPSLICNFGPGSSWCEKFTCF